MLSKIISISEKINSISDFAKLLFTWMIPHSDDFGRMDGTPKKVKALVMPLSKHPIKKFEIALGEMASSGVIYWYTTYNNEVYLQIFNFEDHQTGLDRRTKSKFPDLPSEEEKFFPSENFLEVLRNSSLTKPNLTKLNLTKPNRFSACSNNFSEIVDKWNKAMQGTGIPIIYDLSETREKKLRARLSEPKFEESFDELIKKIKSSEFLLGKTGGWKASFDWVIENDTNYLKVLEGKYSSNALTFSPPPTYKPPEPEGNIPTPEEAKKFIEEIKLKQKELNSCA
ncbi:hypothetical protein A3J90_08405 [candidate division WOR-1 bacterium RIFOXYC2_FULL_37_10]|nr:MAG: hypothetical protein A3J90_08405 [candidate division WOR-1 bacterium RIFOXYC2_FULL_37_10]